MDNTSQKDQPVSGDGRNVVGIDIPNGPSPRNRQGPAEATLKRKTSMTPLASIFSRLTLHSRSSPHEET